MEVVKVSRSRIKTLLLIIAAIGFVATGVWMIAAKDSDIFLKVIGAVSVLFFGSAIPLGLKKLINNDDGLHLTSNALIIEPDSTQKLVIPWTEIIGFRVVKIQSTKIIVVDVDNPEDWLSRESNPIKRKLMQFNQSTYGTPFNISASGLNLSHNKVLAELELFHNQYS